MKRHFLTALTLAMAAGSAGAATDLVVSPKGGVIAYQGRTLRRAQGEVSSARITQVPGSRALVATWDERTGKSVQRFYALSTNGVSFAEASPTTYDVRLVYASFDPVRAEPAIPESWRAGADNRLYLVQFIAPPIDEFRRGVRSLGGTVQTFLTEHTHVISMDAGAAARVAQLPYVRWVGPYHPAYRMSPEVRADVLAGAADAPRRYSIECLERGAAAQQAVANEVARLGGIVELATQGQYRLEATLTPAQVLAIARLNQVNYIDPWGGPGGTDMNVIRQLMGAVPTLSSAGFTGQGVRGEVFDTEVRMTHQAFQTPPPLLHGASAGNAGNAHGSACYGINFANWPANPTYDGMVTNAQQGIFFDYTLASQFGGATSRLTLNTEATNPAGPYRSCYQTASVGSNLTTAYTTVSAETDDYLFLVDYLSCQSQSNANSMDSRPQAWAKNIVSVGGVSWMGTLARVDDGASGASFGPAADGRFKPDLANCYDLIPAPGTPPTPARLPSAAPPALHPSPPGASACSCRCGTRASGPASAAHPRSSTAARAPPPPRR